VGKGVRSGLIIVFLAIVCVLLFDFIDRRREMRLFFVFPQELNFRFTPAKPFLFSTLEGYFEDSGAKVDVIARTYRTGEAVSPLLEAFAKDAFPKVLYWFGDPSELQNLGKMEASALVFSLYPVPLQLLAAHPQICSPYGSMESFTLAVRSLVESEKVGHLKIIVDSHHSFLGERVLEGLGVDFQWVPVEEAVKWSLDGVSAPTPPSSSDALFLFLCEPEWVTQIARAWEFSQFDRVILGPWSIPVDTFYTDTRTLAGIRFLLKPSLGTEAAYSWAEPVYPWVTYVVEASKAFFSDKGQSGVKPSADWFSRSARAISLLPQEQRNAQSEAVWTLWEYTASGSLLKKRYDPITQGWEGCP